MKSSTFSLRNITQVTLFALGLTACGANATPDSISKGGGAYCGFDYVEVTANGTYVGNAVKVYRDRDKGCRPDSAMARVARNVCNKRKAPSNKCIAAYG